MSQSLIQTALGDEWSQLAEPVRRHYDLHPDGQERYTLQGTMRVDYPTRVWPLILAARMSGALVHRRGENIPVTVQNQARRDTLHWHRTFRYPDREVVFASRMEHLPGNEIVENVGWGLGIRLRLSARDGGLVFQSHGYLWRWGPLRLKLPDWLLLGTAEIREHADGANGVRLDFKIVHPWWGPTYTYGGRFQSPEETTS